MSNNNLAGKALQFIYRYWKNHNHEYPTSGEISGALGKKTAHWGNLRSKLIEKGLLKPSLVWGIELTDADSTDKRFSIDCFGSNPMAKQNAIV